MNRWVLAAIIAGVLILIWSRRALALAIKTGVILPTPLKPTTARILDAVSRVWEEFGLRATITSAQDGRHSALSKHYTGDAIDFRTNNIADKGKVKVMSNKVTQILGSDYDVVLEDLGKPNEHLHVEFDPK